MARPKAYSYVRFSTPAQAEGDSLRRQMAAARAYAEKHGLDLQEASFQDLGVSAFHGANADSGHLAEFIDAVKLGVIEKGSVLLMENLDRLSRMKPRLARRLLEDILDSGIDVVTLSDGKRYNQTDMDEDPYAMMMVLMVATRAYQESKIKGERVRAAWAQKKKNAGTQKLTRRVPSWLTLSEDRKSFIIDEEKAEAVRYVFRLAAQGLGQNSIAKRLNTEGVPTLTVGAHWYKSTVQKLLLSEAVIGTYIPHDVVREEGRKVRKPLESVPNYYPCIVDEALWNDTRVERPKGRAAANLVNVLSGVAVCSRCGGAMIYVTKSVKDRYLVCQKAKVGAGCAYRSVRYAVVEDAVLRIAPLANPLSFSGNSETSTKLAGELANVEGEIEAMRNRLLDLSDSKSASSREAIAQLDIALVEAEERREQIQDRLEESEPAILMARLNALHDALYTENRSSNKVNRLLRQLVDRVVVDTSDDMGAKDLVFEWKNGGHTSVVYGWKNQA